MIDPAPIRRLFLQFIRDQNRLYRLEGIDAKIKYLKPRPNRIGLQLRFARSLSKLILIAHPSTTAGRM